MIRLFLACWLPIIVAYADSFVWVYDRWMRGDYYSHGPILPFVAAFVIYSQRDVWSKLEARIDPRGWWLLGIGLLMRFVGAAQMVDSISAASLLFTISGVVMLTVGVPRLKVLLPVILLLVFATPMPMDLTGRLAFELKEIAIQGALAIAELLQLGLVRSGANIHVPGQTVALPVADACGGLRSLLALTTLGYCLAFFMGTKAWSRRVIILLLTVPVAVGVNILRIVGLCIMAKQVDVYYAGGTGHTIMNLCAWIVNIGVLLAVDSVLERRADRKAVVLQEAQA